MMMYSSVKLELEVPGASGASAKGSGGGETAVDMAAAAPTRMSNSDDLV
jgi:hypothetical protein